MFKLNKQVPLYQLLLFFIAVTVLSSCSIFYPSVMFRTGKKFNYSPPDTNPSVEYKIAPDDVVSFRVFSNDGFRLVDLSNSNDQSVARTISSASSYIVEFDGIIKLPILGRIKISEKTIREAELYLEELYSNYYNKPFVLLNISNKRIIIFPGSGSTASVLGLQNNNTTLLEALASVGGINGKAKRIKLIRGDLKNPKVYLIDLSTIKGMKEADMVMQAGDIIYVEPIYAVHKAIISEINVYLALVNSFLLIYGLFFLNK